MNWTLDRAVGMRKCLFWLILARTQVSLGQGKLTFCGPKSLSVYIQQHILFDSRAVQRQSCFESICCLLPTISSCSPSSRHTMELNFLVLWWLWGPYSLFLASELRREVACVSSSELQHLTAGMRPSQVLFPLCHWHLGMWELVVAASVWIPG